MYRLENTREKKNKKKKETKRKSVGFDNFALPRDQACYHCIPPIFLRHYFMPVNLTPLLHPPVYKKPSTHVFPTNARFIPLSKKTKRSIVLTSPPPPDSLRLMMLGDPPRLHPSAEFSFFAARVASINPAPPRRKAERQKQFRATLDVEIALIRMIYGRLGRAWLVVAKYTDTKYTWTRS